MAILEIKNLKTHYFTLRGTVKAVDGVSFDVKKGEMLGLAGESGSGKTTTALSIMSLIPPPGRFVGGEILFDGENLIEKSELEMNKIRWNRISIVFQGAMNALNPMYKVRDQISEAILTHENVNKTEAWRRSEELMTSVGINPQFVKSYPHELSGGMKQRVMIAMALSCNPDLTIFDEPTSALDVMVVAQIMELIKDLQKKINLASILVTHDLSVIAEVCDKVAIMYSGQLVEYADVFSIFKNPTHPYSQGLIKSFPSLNGTRTRMNSISGSPPDLLEPPPGCRFHPRCSYAKDRCRKEVPELIHLRDGHHVACHLDEIEKSWG